MLLKAGPVARQQALRAPELVGGANWCGRSCDVWHVSYHQVRPTLSTGGGAWRAWCKIDGSS